MYDMLSAMEYNFRELLTKTIQLKINARKDLSLMETKNNRKGVLPLQAEAGGCIVSEINDLINKQNRMCEVLDELINQTGIFINNEAKQKEVL